MCILSSMIGIGVLLADTTYKRAACEYMDDKLHLAARTCLTEYNVELQKEYGIYGFYGADEKDLSNRFKRCMIGQRNHDKKGRFTLEVQDILKELDFNISTHPLTNIELFRKSILDTFDFRDLSIIKNFNKQGVEVIEEYNKSRSLMNSSIKETLPSREMNIASNILYDLFLGSNLSIRHPIVSQKINAYILSKFNYHTNIQRNRFFNHEIEYILTGEYESQKCFDKVAGRLKVFFTGMNMVYLSVDASKQAELTEMAAITGTPTTAAAVKIALQIAWAEREAENDIRLLQNGYCVPIKKNTVNWATRLYDVVNRPTTENAEPSFPIKVDGLNYSGYLNMMLHALNEETKLVRMMDLIQINLKVMSSENFLLKNYYGGMEFDAILKYETLHFIETY